MSSALLDVWEPSGIDTSRCKTPTLLEYLNELDVLARTYDPEEISSEEIDRELTVRDDQRVRILKRLTAAPEGLMVKTLVSEVVKGQRPGECERFDGSDADYQFVYRYVNALAAREPPLVEKRKTGGASLVTPTHRLLDLISEGISQTTGEGDPNLYDRQFCETYLRTAGSVSDQGRRMLEDSLHRYVDRIEDYRLLFDVHLMGRRTGANNTKRMTKNYKTRFNSQGRIRKAWARFNQSLEYAYERYDNAVLMTLTTDPGTYDDPTRPDPRSLGEMIEEINPNYNRLLSYMDTDPSTIPDARLSSTPNYPEATGRPRYRPPYLKALEFTEKGYPHLHVLMFDVPTRESDGMPYLIDKQELSDKWKDYGQGQIVDLYPLTFRDDLDEIEGQPFGTKELLIDDDDGGKKEIDVPISEGFVDWYRYGDHSHGEEWIEENARSHDLIDFAQKEGMQARTAGAYLGKYLSATFGSLLEAAGSESLEETDSYADKAATWKLGMYWATGKRFWSVCREIERGIEKPEHLQDPDVRETVRWASIDSLAAASRPAVLEHHARGSLDSLDELRAKVNDTLDDVVTPGVEATLPESADFRAHIEYLGCFSYWDLPRKDFSAPSVELVEDFVPAANGPETPDVGGPKPPPIADVWGDSSTAA